MSTHLFLSCTSLSFLPSLAFTIPTNTPPAPPQPTMFLPRTLSTIADTRNALRASRSSSVRRSRGRAVCGRSGAGGGGVGEGAGWVWEEKAKGKGEEGGEKRSKRREHAHEPDEPPFALHDISLHPARHARRRRRARGGGKSSLLQGLMGDALHRHRVLGERGVLSAVGVDQNGLWDNVLFGQPFEEDRYWHVIEDSYLLPDLQLLADGDLTEIGEKGSIYRASRCQTSASACYIADSLAGGQRQRVNIARALYYGADVVIFDDPLSAVPDVDGTRSRCHVGKALFRSAIQGLVVQGKTVSSSRTRCTSSRSATILYARRGASRGGTYPSSSRGGEFARLDRELGGEGGGCRRGGRGGEWGRRRGAGAGGVGRGRIFGKDIDTIDNALPKDEDVGGVRKDLVAFEK
ncbi:hypothetical protein B0H13DRAFT_1902121 [Mycena leptocephala]|nr:hypothetical protein B0H13DRAFT_1902121 [Mycena leptocephala]